MLENMSGWFEKGDVKIKRSPVKILKQIKYFPDQFWGGEQFIHLGFSHFY